MGETQEQCLHRVETSCRPTNRQVCGTDGNSYPSRCHLLRVQCQPGREILTVKHRGRCRISKSKAKCLATLEHTKKNPPSASDASWYVPKCLVDGNYAPVQCYNNTGFCWCVDSMGQPVPNTTVKRNKNGKTRCVPQGKSVTQRRSSIRGRGNKRSCSLADKALFNSNLIDKFHDEWTRKHDEVLYGAELDRVVLEWKFKDMDKNQDGKLDKTEYRDLRKLVKIFVKPKRCSKSFARACDIDQDQHISNQEWGDCLTRDGMNDEKQNGGDGSNGDLDNSSMDRDDEDEDTEDYEEEQDFMPKSPPPHGILQTGGPSVSSSQPSGEDTNERPDEEANDCLSDRQAVLNEQRAEKMYVPECTPDGRYKKIQCYKSVGYCWCVHEDTGKNIPGTSVQHITPQCDQVPTSMRPMNGCPEPKKAAFLKDLMEFLHNRMVSGTNGTNITGSESGGWQATREEKAATWNFVVLDKNKNKVLERKEWKVFRALVSASKQLRRCGKKLPRYCDVNSDQKISLSEWLECLNTTRNIPGGNMPNPRPAPQRQGKNPLHSFLKDD